MMSEGTQDYAHLYAVRCIPARHLASGQPRESLCGCALPDGCYGGLGGSHCYDVVYGRSPVQIVYGKCPAYWSKVAG
jgi:hypothetical protein